MLALVLLWTGAWLVVSGTAKRLESEANTAFFRVSAGYGFAIRDILIEGRQNADPDVLLGLIHAGRGDPIFAFDPAAAQTALEKDSWIASARVERRLPDIIFVQVIERRPFALWQNKGKIGLIDRDGNVITRSRKEMAPFSALPLVVGAGAEKEAGAFLALLQAEPDVAQRAEAAVYVGDRRWDLHLKNGVTARLPDGDQALALRRLADAQEKDKLLDRQDIDTIDLREANRMIIRVKSGATQDYGQMERPEKAI